MPSTNRSVILENAHISLNDIKKLSKDKKRKLLMITNMLRDLNLLQKWMIFATKNMQEKTSIKADESITVYLFLLKTFISKLHEMWEFIERHSLLKNKRQLELKTCQALSILEQFYNVNKVKDTFDFIRNKFGFHYEWMADVEKQIETAMEVDKFEMLLSSEDSGNDIFVSSNRIMLAVIMEEMRKNGYKGDRKVLLKQLIETALESAKLFREFCVNYLNYDILKNVKLEKTGKVVVEAPFLREVSLPLIVKNDYPKV